MNSMEKRLVRYILRLVTNLGNDMYNSQETEVTELLEILLEGDEDE